MYKLWSHAWLCNGITRHFTKCSNNSQNYNDIYCFPSLSPNHIMDSWYGHLLNLVIPCYLISNDGVIFQFFKIIIYLFIKCKNNSNSKPSTFILNFNKFGFKITHYTLFNVPQLYYTLPNNFLLTISYLILVWKIICTSFSISFEHLKYYWFEKWIDNIFYISR